MKDSAFSGSKRECFDATIVPSDYVKFATNTVEGIRRFNELKALEEEGDLEVYYAKFEPKSVTYSSNVIYRAVSFYPKVRPSAMFMYDFSRYLPLPRSSTSLPSNGVEIVSYPVAEYDPFFPRMPIPMMFLNRRRSMLIETTPTLRPTSAKILRMVQGLKLAGRDGGNRVGPIRARSCLEFLCQRFIQN